MAALTPWLADMQWPTQFDVSVGVQENNQQLVKDIDRILARRSHDIRRLLMAYNVPLISSH